jgi:hypothetical protein
MPIRWHAKPCETSLNFFNTQVLSHHDMLIHIFELLCCSRHAKLLYWPIITVL